MLGGSKKVTKRKWHEFLDWNRIELTATYQSFDFITITMFVAPYEVKSGQSKPCKDLNDMNWKTIIDKDGNQYNDLSPVVIAISRYSKRGEEAYSELVYLPIETRIRLALDRNISVYNLKSRDAMYLVDELEIFDDTYYIVKE